MFTRQHFATACAAMLSVAGPGQAQEAAAAAPTPDCELHVWPTENYIGINSGLLSGFGLVGAVADIAAH